ncbi:MAG: DUF401 family protein [Anaerolineae bacterium]|nr:DUF401 family protein [Anaerolineae bacterium]
MSKASLFGSGHPLRRGFPLSCQQVQDVAMMPLIKLSIVFAGIVLLLSRRWNLGFVLLLACAAVGLVFGYPLRAVGRDVVLTSVDLFTLQLALSILLIMLLSELLRETASLQGMVRALQALIPSGRLVIAALPALVGLLPMVGGAMFSAPMVNEVGDRFNVDRERKTFINYWFRHIWEYVFPLYPSMMLAAALLSLETFQLASATWPLTAAAVVSGGLFGLIGMPRTPNSAIESSARLAGLRTLLISIWPIGLVILLSLALPLDSRFTLILALVVTIALVMVINGMSLQTLGHILHKRIPWKTIAVLFGALIFRRVLENSGAVHGVSEALVQSHVPLVAIAFLVPFVAGLLTGLSHAAFSIGFPVVVPLVASDGAAITSGWAAWMMAGAFLGVMCSPLHLCLSLTRLYFEADWGPIYRRIAPSSLVVAATAAVLLLS